MSNDHSTGKTCKACGASNFYKSGRCAECARAYAAAHRKENPEKVKAAAAKWRSKNPEKIKARLREWRAENAPRLADYGRSYRANNHAKVKAIYAAYRAANPEMVKGWARLSRLRNREKVAARDAAYYAANAEAIREKVLRWQRENPEACRIRGQNRRAKMTGGKLSKDLAKKLFALQKGRCPCCRQPLGSDYHLDHIIPLSRGGQNVDSNIQLLRKTCNHQKHARSPVEFMQSKGFLL